MASSEFEASTPYFITDEWFRNATFAAAGIKKDNVKEKEGKLERGFAGPDIFVTEGKLKNNHGVYETSECTFGTCVLLQNPSTWGEQDKSMRRFVITAADCVSKPRPGRKKGVDRVDELRLRVPIRPWEDFPDDVKYYRAGAEETVHLYDEINSQRGNIFINEKFGIALIAIPEMAPSVDATTHYFDIAGNSPSESMSWIQVNGFPAECNHDSRIGETFRPCFKTIFNRIQGLIQGKQEKMYNFTNQPPLNCSIIIFLLFLVVVHHTLE